MSGLIMLKQNASRRVKNLKEPERSFPKAIPTASSRASKPSPPAAHPSSAPTHADLSSRSQQPDTSSDQPPPLALPQDLDPAFRGALAALASTDPVVLSVALSTIASALETAARSIATPSVPTASRAARTFASVLLQPAALRSLLSAVQHIMSPQAPDGHAHPSGVEDEGLEYDAGDTHSVTVAALAGVASVAPRVGYDSPALRAAIQVVNAVVSVVGGPVDATTSTFSPAFRYFEACVARGPYASSLRGAGVGVGGDDGRGGDVLSTLVGGADGLVGVVVRAVGRSLMRVEAGMIAAVGGGGGSADYAAAVRALERASVPADAVSCASGCLATVGVLWPQVAVKTCRALRREVAALYAIVGVSSLVTERFSSYLHTTSAPSATPSSFGLGVPLRRKAGVAEVEGLEVLSASAQVVSLAAVMCSLAAPPRCALRYCDGESDKRVVVCNVHIEGSLAQAAARADGDSVCGFCPAVPFDREASDGGGGGLSVPRPLAKTFSMGVAMVSEGRICGKVLRSAAWGVRTLAARVTRLALEGSGKEMPSFTTFGEGDVDAQCGIKGTAAGAVDGEALSHVAGEDLGRALLASLRHSVGAAAVVEHLALCMLLSIQFHSRCKPLRDVAAQHMVLAAALRVVSDVDAALSTLCERGGNGLHTKSDPFAITDTSSLSSCGCVEGGKAPVGDAHEHTTLTLACEPADAVESSLGGGVGAVVAACGAWIGAAANLLAVTATGCRGLNTTALRDAAVVVLERCEAWCASFGSAAGAPLLVSLRRPLMTLVASAATLLARCGEGDGEAPSLSSLATLHAHLQVSSPLWQLAWRTVAGDDPSQQVGVPYSALLSVVVRGAVTVDKSSSQLSAAPFHPRAVAAIADVGAAGCVIAWGVAAATAGFESRDGAIISTCEAVLRCVTQWAGSATIAAALSLYITGNATVLGGSAEAKGADMRPRRRGGRGGAPAMSQVLVATADIASAAAAANLSVSRCPYVASNVLALLCPARPPPAVLVHGGLLAPLAAAGSAPKAAASTFWRALAGLLALPPAPEGLLPSSSRPLCGPSIAASAALSTLKRRDGESSVWGVDVLLEVRWATLEASGEGVGAGTPPHTVSADDVAIDSGESDPPTLSELAIVVGWGNCVGALAVEASSCSSSGPVSWVGCLSPGTLCSYVTEVAVELVTSLLSEACSSVAAPLPFDPSDSSMCGKLIAEPPGWVVEGAISTGVVAAADSPSSAPADETFGSKHPDREMEIETASAGAADAFRRFMLKASSVAISRPAPTPPTTRLQLKLTGGGYPPSSSAAGPLPRPVHTQHAKPQRLPAGGVGGWLAAAWCALGLAVDAASVASLQLATSLASTHCGNVSRPLALSSRGKGVTEPSGAQLVGVVEHLRMRCGPDAVATSWKRGIKVNELVVSEASVVDVIGWLTFGLYLPSDDNVFKVPDWAVDSVSDDAAELAVYFPDGRIGSLHMWRKLLDSFAVLCGGGSATSLPPLRTQRRVLVRPIESVPKQAAAGCEAVVGAHRSEYALRGSVFVAATPSVWSHDVPSTTPKHEDVDNEAEAEAARSMGAVPRCVRVVQEAVSLAGTCVGGCENDSTPQCVASRAVVSSLLPQSSTASTTAAALRALEADLGARSAVEGWLGNLWEDAMRDAQRSADPFAGGVWVTVADGGGCSGVCVDTPPTALYVPAHVVCVVSGCPSDVHLLHAWAEVVSAVVRRASPNAASSSLWSLFGPLGTLGVAALLSTRTPSGPGMLAHALQRGSSNSVHHAETIARVCDALLGGHCVRLTNLRTLLKSAKV